MSCQECGYPAEAHFPSDAGPESVCPVVFHEALSPEELAAFWSPRVARPGELGTGGGGMSRVYYAGPSSEMR